MRVAGNPCASASGPRKRNAEQNGRLWSSRGPVRTSPAGKRPLRPTRVKPACYLGLRLGIGAIVPLELQ